MRLSLTRDDFDELVTTVLAGSAFVALAATAYLSYWFVFIAPDLPAQLAQLSASAGVGASAPAGAPLLSAPTGSWLSALSGALQPSLFR